VSDVLVVLPYDASEGLSGWLRSFGIEPPGETGHVPDSALLGSILREADWPFRTSERDGVWAADFESREERWPPIQELTLREGSVGFRLGPVYGPYVVAREVARRCGPQVAVSGSFGSPCLVGPTTTYEEFHELVAGCPAPADGADRDWSAPPTEAWKYANAMPDEWPDSPEGLLDYALSGRRGHATAATNVGAALQLYRSRDQGAGQPRVALDEPRYAALVARLTAYVRSTAVPHPGLVWALGQVPEARSELEALAQRLEGVEEAAESRRMALLFLGRPR
jgi:hypothetical protein